MKKSILLKVLVIGVSVYLIITLTGLCKDLILAKSELSDLKNQAVQKQQRIEELENLLSEGNEKKLIEKAARQRFDYSYPDEKKFVDTYGK